jgi:hypothetical protein
MNDYNLILNRSKDIHLDSNNQTGSRAHPVYSSVGIWGSISWAKAAVKLIHHLHPMMWNA